MCSSLYMGCLNNITSITEQSIWNLNLQNAMRDWKPGYLCYICHEQSGNLHNLQIALHNLKLLKYNPIWWLEQSENYFLAQSADRSGAIFRSLRCNLQIAQLCNLQIAQRQSADRSGAICRSMWVNRYMWNIYVHPFHVSYRLICECGKTSIRIFLSICIF